MWVINLWQETAFFWGGGVRFFYFNKFMYKTKKTFSEKLGYVFYETNWEVV